MTFFRFFIWKVHTVVTKLSSLMCWYKSAFWSHSLSYLLFSYTQAVKDSAESKLSAVQKVLSPAENRPRQCKTVNKIKIIKSGIWIKCFLNDSQNRFSECCPGRFSFLIISHLNTNTFWKKYFGIFTKSKKLTELCYSKNIANKSANLYSHPFQS